MVRWIVVFINIPQFYYPLSGDPPGYSPELIVSPFDRFDIVGTDRDVKLSIFWNGELFNGIYQIAGYEMIFSWDGVLAIDDKGPHFKNGFKIRHNFPGDLAISSQVSGPSWLIAFLCAVNHPNNSIVIERTDNRKKKRHPFPPLEHERKFIKERYIIVGRDELIERWKGDPGNGSKKMPHIRRGHIRRLASGATTIVRPCTIHNEDFTWDKHGRNYRVVSMRSPGQSCPASSQSVNSAS